MAIARSTGALLGTSESTGVSTLATTATSSGSQVDVLGDDTSVGDLNVYLVFTSTVTVGSIDVTINRHRVTGGGYIQASAQFSVPPVNATAKYYLGRIPASRYMDASLKNNATGAAVTNFSVLYELFKVTLT